MKKGIVKRVLLIMVVMILASCTMLGVGTQSDNSQSDNAQTKKLSPLASDPAFMKSLHVIRNETTNTSSVVRGDGTIIINAMRPDIDSLGVVKDARTGEDTFAYKIVQGEDVKRGSYTDAYSGETYYYPEAINYAVFYDNNGKEIGLKADTYGYELAIGDKIFFDDMKKEYNENLYIFDVKTKEIVKSPKERVTFFGSHVLISSEPYTDDDPKKEILVCDDNLQVLRTIDNYSYSDLKEYEDIKVCEVRRTDIKNTEKALKDLEYGTEYSYKYNYLDENLNFIFEEDIDAGFYFNDSSTVTLHRGDIEFDYDFKNMKTVGEPRQYKGYDNNNDKYWSERRVYDSATEYIKSTNGKYTYVETKIHNGKVLFFAHYPDENENYDDPAYTYKDHVDVYSVDLELLGSYDHLNSIYEEEGFFEADYDAIYDFDLNLIRTFDDKVYISRYTIEDLVYFTDADNQRYETRPKYTIYDKDFNVLYENVVYDSAYSFDDKYFTYAADGKTRILDSSLKVIKEYDREISIQGWYDSKKYKVFTDNNTKRMGIINDKFDIIVDRLKSVNGLEENCFSFANGFKYGLMDYNGLEICSFSIFNTMNEDSRNRDADIRLLE